MYVHMFYDKNNNTRPMIMYILACGSPKSKFLVPSKMCQNPENPKNGAFFRKNALKWFSYMSYLCSTGPKMGV